jgi:hypothetical protein
VTISRETTMTPTSRRPLLTVAVLAAVVVVLAIGGLTWTLAGGGTAHAKARPRPAQPSSEVVVTDPESVLALQGRLTPPAAPMQVPAMEPAAVVLPRAIPGPAGSPKSDQRAFAQMAEAWENEKDDADWSLNVRTFMGAIEESLDDGTDAAARARGMDAVSVQCRQSVCKIEAEQPDMVTLGRVLRASADTQPHVTFQTSMGDAGSLVTAYLGRDPAQVGEQGL